MSFGKVRKLIKQFSSTWTVLEKAGFSKRLRKSFVFLFGKILKYPKVDTT